MGFKDILREFYGEFVNYFNCLPNKDKEEKEEREERDWELWDNKSYEKIPPPAFPKLPQQTSERGFSRYLW